MFKPKASAAKMQILFPNILQGKPDVQKAGPWHHRFLALITALDVFRNTPFFKENKPTLSLPSVTFRTVQEFVPITETLFPRSTSPVFCHPRLVNQPLPRISAAEVLR